MSKRLFFVAVAFVGTAISDVTAVQHSTPAPDRVQGAPNVIAARHDRSARLRDIPPGPPLPLDRTELADWAPRVQEIAAQAKETHVLFNNNYQDQGQRGAAALTQLLRS